MDQHHNFIIIKMERVKERILKAVRGKQRVIYKVTPTRLSVDFSTETLQTRREWHDIFKMLKRKTCNLGYSAQQDYHLKLKGVNMKM